MPFFFTNKCIFLFVHNLFSFSTLAYSWTCFFSSHKATQSLTSNKKNDNQLVVVSIFMGSCDEKPPNLAHTHPPINKQTTTKKNPVQSLIKFNLVITKKEKKNPKVCML